MTTFNPNNPTYLDPNTGEPTTPPPPRGPGNGAAPPTNPDGTPNPFAGAVPAAPGTNPPNPTTPPAAAPGFDPSTYYGKTDPASIKAYVHAWFVKNGWGATDPGGADEGYYVTKVTQNGGPSAYWDGRFGTFGSGSGGPGKDLTVFGAPYDKPFNAPAPYAPPGSMPTFTSPTGVTEQNDPGYQFRLGQGEQALQQSAAARGTLGTGGTLKDILNYGQDYASNEYGNLWNRAYQTYQGAMNAYQANVGNTKNAYDTNYGNQWQRYMQDYNAFRNTQNDQWAHYLGQTSVV